MKKIILSTLCFVSIGCAAKVVDPNKDPDDAGVSDSNLDVSLDCGGPPNGCVLDTDASNVCKQDCNFCSCFEGEWACTLMACFDDASVGVCSNLPDGCIARTNAQDVCDLDCNTCSCSQGDWICTQRACADQ